MAAIEKDLNLVPIVSNQIGTIHEDERECELSDTNKTKKEKRIHHLQMFSGGGGDGGGTEERASNPQRESDEVHKAH